MRLEFTQAAGEFPADLGRCIQIIGRVFEQLHMIEGGLRTAPVDHRLARGARCGGEIAWRRHAGGCRGCDSNGRAPSAGAPPDRPGADTHFVLYPAVDRAASGAEGRVVDHHGHPFAIGCFAQLRFKGQPLAAWIIPDGGDRHAVCVTEGKGHGGKRQPSRHSQRGVALGWGSAARRSTFDLGSIIQPVARLHFRKLCLDRLGAHKQAKALNLEPGVDAHHLCLETAEPAPQQIEASQIQQRGQMPAIGIEAFGMAIADANGLVVVRDVVGRQRLWIAVRVRIAIGHGQRVCFLLPVPDRAFGIEHLDRAGAVARGRPLFHAQRLDCIVGNGDVGFFPPARPDIQLAIGILEGPAIGRLQHVGEHILAVFIDQRIAGPAAPAGNRTAPSSRHRIVRYRCLDRDIGPVYIVEPAAIAIAVGPVIRRHQRPVVRPRPGRGIVHPLWPGAHDNEAFAIVVNHGRAVLARIVAGAPFADLRIFRHPPVIDGVEIFLIHRVADDGDMRTSALAVVGCPFREDGGQLADRGLIGISGAGDDMHRALEAGIADGAAAIHVHHFIVQSVLDDVVLMPRAQRQHLAQRAVLAGFEADLSAGMDDAPVLLARSHRRARFNLAVFRLGPTGLEQLR